MEAGTVIRRRRSKDRDIRLEPVGSIRVVDGVHESLGSNPSYRVTSKQTELPSGWCRISYRGHSVRGYLSPRLRIESIADGDSNVLIELPPSRGQLVTAVRRLPPHVASMQLSPVDGPGRFWIEDFDISQITGPALLLQIARRGLRQVTSDPVRLGAWSRIAWRIWRGGNLNSLKIFVARWLEQSDLDYRTWVTYHDSLTDEDRAAIQTHIAALRRPIRFSIVIRLDDTAEERLRGCLESSIEQIYRNWEIWIAHDSVSLHIHAVLEEYCRRDYRIRVATASAGDGLVGACNRALELATGDYFVLLDPNGALAEHACYLFAEAFAADLDLELVYADEDELSSSGQRASPWFKGGWDAERLLQQDYVSRCCAVHARLARKVGGFRSGYAGSATYDLVLRCAAAIAHRQIAHLPFVAYHAHDKSGAQSADLTGQRVQDTVRLRAVADHLHATETRAAVELGPVPGVLRVRYGVPEPQPLVTLIIPTRNGPDLVKRCIDSIVSRTLYPAFEILLLDNESDDPVALAYFRHLELAGSVRLMRFDGPFNYAAINNFAAKHASGDVLGLLNNDTEVIGGEWLTEMVAHATRPEIGAVGAMLLYPDRTVQHAGVVMGLHGTVGHLLHRAAGEAAGYANCLAVAREVTAVTGACLLVKRSAYEGVGGLDEANLPVTFNDIDLCLNLRSRGYRNIWTPHALLYHHEGATRGPDESPEKAARFNAEWAYMKRRWGSVLNEDPFYSPNLSLASDDCSLSFPPRCEVPWSRDVRFGHDTGESELSPARTGR